MERSRRGVGSRRVAVAAAAFILALGAGCAGPASVRPAPPGLETADVPPDDDAPEGAGTARGYERSENLRASELLAPELLSGPHHRVREEVGSDGFLHRYVVESDFGTFEVAGDALLRTRLREVEALAELDRMQKRDEFARAMAAGLKSPFVATWNLLRDPVDSILGIPQGAWETVKRTAELARGERGELEDSGFREFIGFEARKRDLAFQLGVDPYSSNRELQKQLNRFAWAAYLGGLPFTLVPFQDDDPLELGPASEDAGERLRDILREFAPEDLRRLNRIELAVMGVPEALADAFLAHDWYSPRHSTILVASLVALDPAADRARFIETSLQAGSEADARSYQQAAQLLRAYHEGQDPIARIVADRNAVMGVSFAGDLVVPLVLDHAVWSRSAAELGERVVDRRDALGAARARLLVSGTLSERARRELGARGLVVSERAFEQLAPPPDAETGRSEPGP